MIKTETSLNAPWLVGLQTSTNYTFQIHVKLLSRLSRVSI